jgi:SAM-dependent methyltransferase
VASLAPSPPAPGAEFVRVEPTDWSSKWLKGDRPKITEDAVSFKVIAKQIVWLAAQIPPLRAIIIAYYERKRNNGGWKREHPYDRALGVRTSGWLPGFVLKPGDPFAASTTAYIAAQPSIVRAALAAIPNPQDCHFLDLGCGKGRPLLVATEFNFRAITGVELSPALSRCARRNAAALARANPTRTRIRIVTGDATTFNLPPEKLVVFLYHPFGRPQILQLLANVEEFLRALHLNLYIVYYNPFWADVFDTSTSLERRYAAQLPYNPSEIGYGPDDSDAVVIWQDRGNPYPRPASIIPASTPVTIVSPSRAEIEV